MTPSSKTPSSSNLNARIRVYWGNTLYDTQVVSPGDRVTVGKSPRNTFILDFDSGVLGESWELMRVYPRRTELLYRSKTTGKAQLGSERYSLAELVEKKLAVAESAGVYRLQLTEQDQADIELSDLRFRIDWVSAAPRIRKAVSERERGQWWWNALVTSALTVAVLGMVYLSRHTDPPAAPLKTRSVKLLPRLTPVPPVPPPEVVKPAPVPEPVPEPVKAAPAKPKPTVAKKTPPAPAKPVAPPAPKDEMADLGDMVKGLSNIGSSTGKKPASKGRTPALAVPGLGASSDGLPQNIETEQVGTTVGQGTGKFKMTKTERATAGTTEVSGEATTLANDAIEGVIRRKEASIRRCYERELSKNPGLQGSFVTRFFITPKGRINSVQVAEDTLKNSATHQCVIGELKQMQFPVGFEKTAVEYPFVFEPTVR